jgi:hypothetical protein
VSRQARSLRVLLITDSTGPQYWIRGPRAAAFKRELENHRVVVEGLPDDWAKIDLSRWIADFRWDAAVVVPYGVDMLSSPMGMAYMSATDVRMRLGRPRLFISLVPEAQLPWFYSRGMPTLLPEEPQEAVPLLITAMKAKS